MAQLLRKTHPATGALLAELACTPLNEVASLVRKAREAQRAWGALPVRERGRAITRVAQLMAQQAQSLAQLIADETGKPRLEAMLQEVLGATHLASYFGNHAPRILRPERLARGLFVHRRSYLHYVPRGVIGIIGPWNFPLTLTWGDALMALCAGNAVVLKPSEHTPLCALRLREIIKAAGIDAELLQIALGYGDVGAAVIEAQVDMVHFTGSVATGRKVAQACGQRLIPCVLELGGKDAAIVLDDADVEHAAQTLVYGAFANAGQVCASVERVYAMPQVYEPLKARMTEITKNLRLGDGSTQDFDIGPLIVNTQLNIVQEHVQKAREAGATVVTGGHAQGPYFAPTLLTDVDESMAVCKEETFGPVLPLMRVSTVAEAIQRANDTLYGLSAYVFTRDKKVGKNIAEQLEAGSVLINDVLITHAAPQAPWGGVKTSGIGHTHADSGLKHLCQARHVNYNTLPSFINPWTYPYREALTPLAALVLQLLFAGGSVITRLKRVMQTVGLTYQVFKNRKGLN